MIYLKYLWYVLRHKWFVFVACVKLRIIWRGIIHDWSKFLPSEFFPYARFFYGKIKGGKNGTGYYKPNDTGKPAFDFAWLLHQKRNAHHWQWWLLPEDEGQVKSLRMQTTYLKEMVADWIGAGRAQGTPNTIKWFEINRKKMTLHPYTEIGVVLLLTAFFQKKAATFAIFPKNTNEISTCMQAFNREHQRFLGFRRMMSEHFAKQIEEKFPSLKVDIDEKAGGTILKIDLKKEKKE